LEQCVARVQRHFSALADASPNLQLWFRKARSKSKANTPIDVTSSDGLRQDLLSGRNRQDVGSREVIPELGFGISFWNGDAGGWTASTSVTCGLYSAVRTISNVALLSVDFGNSASMPPAEMLALLKRLIEVWQPDKGYVFQLDMPLEDDDAEPQRVSYATYRSQAAEDKRRWFFREESKPAGRTEEFSNGRLWIDDSLGPRFEGRVEGSAR
jgi:hypothetical protein